MLEKYRHRNDVRNTTGDLEDDELNLIAATSSSRASGPQEFSSATAAAAAVAAERKEADSYQRRASGSTSLTADTTRRVHGDTEGARGGGAWGKRWEEHRRGILREFAEADDDISVADQVVLVVEKPLMSILLSVLLLSLPPPAWVLSILFVFSFSSCFLAFRSIVFSIVQCYAELERPCFS